MRTVRRRSAMLLAAVLLFAVTAAPAGAEQTSIRWYYAQALNGGTIYCAGAQASIFANASNVAQLGGWAHSNQNVYCATADPNPAGWNEVDTRLVRANNTICRDYDGNTWNADNTSYAYEARSVVTCGAGGYYTRARAVVAANLADRIGSERTNDMSFSG